MERTIENPFVGGGGNNRTSSGKSDVFALWVCTSKSTTLFVCYGAFGMTGGELGWAGLDWIGLDWIGLD